MLHSVNTSVFTEWSSKILSEGQCASASFIFKKKGNMLQIPAFFNCFFLLFT